MKTNHTKDEQSGVRGVDEIKNALHRYASWLLNNPGAEPLERRAKKNTIAVDLFTHLQEQHKAERRELVEEILDEVYKDMEMIVVGQDRLRERDDEGDEYRRYAHTHDYAMLKHTVKSIKEIADRHGLSTKE